jgi:hypothetical protein
MKMSMYGLASETFTGMLGDLSGILDKGAEHAAKARIDPAKLVKAKLAPDMYDLARQVQIACDHAKGTTARLTGVEPPVWEDSEQTIDELKARIAKTIDYVQAAAENAYEGAEDREITFAVPGVTIVMTGLQFLKDWALPHFYFHVVTAYDILRHEGVEIGKREYLGHAAKYIRPPAAA